MSRESSRPFWRRGASLIAAAAIVTAALIPVHAASGGAPTAAPTADATKPTIVLVHGSWADSSSFAPVTMILQNQGYNVVVPPNPLRGLHSDSAYLAAYLQQATTGPLLLVGHSYGGAVITNAAHADPDVLGLVFIDAFAPVEGETTGSIIAGSTSVLNVPDPTTVFNAVAYPGAEHGDVDLYLKPEVFHNSFAQDVPPSVRAVLAAGQRPAAFFTNIDPSGPPAWATLPSWYILGTLDQVIPPKTQREQAERAGSTIVEVRAGHLPMISAPLQVTRVIERAANSVH
ncbi:MAG TPA: alpha/beta hydrolase [Glaciibacter sp.]|nr:alpha/beta hydrolase [Glaciibacter sp.]